MLSMSKVVAYIQTALLSGVLVLLACVLVSMPDELSSLQAAPRETRVDLLLEPLNRLRSTLDSLPQKLRSAMPSGLERRSVVENAQLSKLTAQLARFEQAMRQLPGRATIGNAPDVSRPPAWDRIASLVKTKKGLQDGDQKPFKRKFFLWDEAELLARFGVPTEIHVAASGKEMWNYNDPNRDLYFQFDLHRGRVINVW